MNELILYKEEYVAFTKIMIVLWLTGYYEKHQARRPIIVQVYVKVFHLNHGMNKVLTFWFDLGGVATWEGDHSKIYQLFFIFRFKSTRTWIAWSGRS